MLAECEHDFEEEKKKKNTYVKGKDKFPGADKLIFYLAHSMKVFGDINYTVVYEDRIVGSLECPIDVFLESRDIPFHRIYLFKANGVVCWDRRNKLTTL